MSHSLCKTSVLRIYQEVIDDVINNARDLFAEDGVDEQVLQELKMVWETKLMGSKAVQNEEEKKKPDIATATNGFPKNQTNNQSQQSAANNTTSNTVMQPVTQQQTQQVAPQTAQTVSAPASQPQTIQQQPTGQIRQIIETKMVPIQITLPPAPGGDGTQRVLTIQVPGSALQGNQLQKVLTGPVITATMNLPANIASTLLQQHVDSAFKSQAVTIKNVIQSDGAADCSSTSETVEMDVTAGCSKIKKSTPIEIEFILPKKKRQIKQTDGNMDTSDEDEDGSDNDEDDDDDLDDKDEEDQEMEDEGGEEEPLNSEDDVTDDDPTDLFETDNIVVCQYDKIIRNRNKWKFYLKDGIMNLNGQDYVFQKANGDAEW